MLESSSALFVLPVVAAGVIVRGRRRGAAWPTIGGHLALAGALILIVAFVILPLPIDAEGWRWFGIDPFPLTPFRTIRSSLAYGLVDVEVRHLVGNIALFVPLGFALPLAVPRFRRALRTIGIGAVLALSFEVAQMFIPAHGPDVDDVILNTLGAALGFAGWRIARSVTSVLAPSSPVARAHDPRSGQEAGGGEFAGASGAATSHGHDPNLLDEGESNSPDASREPDLRPPPVPNPASEAPPPRRRNPHIAWPLPRYRPRPDSGDPAASRPSALVRCRRERR